jgi:hypothetical protein
MKQQGNSSPSKTNNFTIKDITNSEEKEILNKGLKKMTRMNN